MTGLRQRVRSARSAMASVLLMLIVGGAHMQDESNVEDALPVTENLALIETTGLFGEPTQAVRGVLRNPTDGLVFSAISVRAEVYDSADSLIGEGFGGAVDVCRASWLPDFVLPPGASTGFDVMLERYETTPIKRVELFVEAQPVTAPALPPLADGITGIVDDEVVEVEWINNTTLRYGVGCARLPFTEWTWMQYDLTRDRTTPTTHPRASSVTPEMRTRLRASTSAEFEHAFIRYAPDGDRLLYQGSVNDLLSASIDGQFNRLIQGGLQGELFRRTLQRVIWGTEERFLAAYYGGYGDPVYYFTATAEARRISPSPTANRPSVIVPGITRDANRAVIAGDFGEGVGYYIVVFNNSFFEKLFDADPPGNNYPSPLPITDPESDLVTRVYVALDDADGSPRLMCFVRESNTLIDLAPLPLSLSQEERAAWWLSPDDATIMLAADGINAGLWRIDLNDLPDCA